MPWSALAPNVLLLSNHTWNWIKLVKAASYGIMAYWELEILPVVIKRRWLWPFVFSLMYISVMIDLCTLSGVLFWPLFCVHFWALSDKSTFLSTSLITFLSSLRREHFFEHSFEHFFEYSRARVLFWALSWALFLVLLGENTFFGTFLSTQKSTLGISSPLCSNCQKASPV